MNLNLNIDNYGGKSVVPVKCREIQGTAFYIGSSYFLTAYHVVSDAEFDGSAIIATVDGKDVLCELVRIENIMDVALLRCLEPIDEDFIEKIPLLDTVFKEGLDLEIIGYPQEIGNGIDYFGVCVRNVRNLSSHSQGFDIVVQRTDAFGFYSYSGFSGSPVLNEYGYAIGIVTDQLHRSLGYTSINSIAQALPKDIVIENNADEFDSRPYGIGTCIKAAEESLKKMSSRYSEDLHSEDLELEKSIRLFCGLDVKEAEEQIRVKFLHWYETLPKNCKKICSNEKDFMQFLKTGVRNNNFYKDLENIFYCEDSKKDYYIRGYYRNKLHDLAKDLEILNDKVSLSKKRLLYITGDAGYGKTHHLCHITKKLCKEVNIYLFFGTEFSKEDNPLRTIAAIRCWEDVDYLKALNDEVAKKNKYAVFVIDALNEGEGTFYWKEKLPQVVHTFDNYPNIKLIVSVRTMERDDELRTVFDKTRWEKKDLAGFSNINAAIRKYFKQYGIYEEPEAFSKYKVFYRPLFLKIFCESFYLLPLNKRKDIDILLLYSLYFRKCNKNVSRWADEDPQRVVTNTLMYCIGRRSLESYQCCDVPRGIAIKLANKICHNRLWSNNLYHSAVKENLLMEYGTRDGSLFATFQYDSMGDYVRATIMLLDNKTDVERFDHMKRLLAKCSQSTIERREKTKILNTLTAFLSVWNPDEKFWEKPDFKRGLLKDCLINSLSDRNMGSDKNTLREDLVKSILVDDDSLFDVIRVFDHFNLYKTTLMPFLHERLMAMNMLERDEKWTLGVNGLLDSYRLSYTINSVYLETDEDIKVYVWLLCWMFTSSHPNLRIRMIRIVRSLLSMHPALCEEIINKFHIVNDPYVLSGVYAAVCGVLMTSRDRQFIHGIADLVYKYHFENETSIPSDIESRIWTLKILEYNNYMNPEDGYWKLSQPPYKTNENLMLYPDTEVYDKYYFGPDGGAYSMGYSLFDWDFNRYIIGTNCNSESSTFSHDGQGVLLADITNAIANRIKHVYGYSQKLSDYDKTIESQDRHYHTKERIGKKYQWIALGEVYAFLCDTCNMTKNWITEEAADRPYPWYACRPFYLDPTFKVDENQMVMDNEMFDYLPQDNLFSIADGREWIDSRMVLPSLNIILKDKEQSEWVVLVGYQKYTEEKNGEKRESFVYYAPCLVMNDDGCSAKFEAWAKDQNFYGRWMPENTGNYEYIWNEYPWADTYKSFGNDEIEIWRHEAPCKIKLPYSAQVQEDTVAIDDEDDINTTVYMPSPELYEMFGLYNAERGVVRDNDGKVIAISRNIPGDALDGLVIRREYLNEFLAKKGYTLFYCNLGEKQLWTGSNLIEMQRLSCCCKYMSESDVLNIQPMTDERDFPPPPPRKDEPLAGINIEDWIKLKPEESEADLLEELKKLDNEDC